MKFSMADPCGKSSGPRGVIRGETARAAPCPIPTVGAATLNSRIVVGPASASACRPLLGRVRRCRRFVGGYRIAFEVTAKAKRHVAGARRGALQGELELARLLEPRGD